MNALYLYLSAAVGAVIGVIIAAVCVISNKPGRT